MAAHHELIPVSFHKDTLYLVEHKGQPFTPAKTIAENIGIDWMGQYRKLNSNQKRWGIEMISIPSAGGNQEMVCLPLRKLPSYLLSIDPRKVKEEIRFKLEVYQEECDDALWAYWNEGVALNPRAAEPEGIYISPAQMASINQNLSDYIELLKAKIPAPRPKRKQPAKLTNEQLCRIYDLERQGYKQNHIAKELGRSTATISHVLQYRPSIPLS